MGITQENWPATVGLLSGVVTKEIVVGTFNAVYDRMGTRGGPTPHAHRGDRGLRPCSPTCASTCTGAVASACATSPCTSTWEPDAMRELFGVWLRKGRVCRVIPASAGECATACGNGCSGYGAPGPETEVYAWTPPGSRGQPPPEPEP